MAKSIIDIDIDTSKLEKAAAALQKIEQFKAKGRGAGLDPDTLARSAKFMEQAKKSAEGVADAQEAAARSQGKLNSALRITNTLAVSTARGFHTIGTSLKSSLSTVISMSSHMAKWGAYSIGAGLLGGGAGLYGMKGLGENLTDLRSRSSGLGISPGQLRALENVYGKYHDIGGLTGSMMSAQTSPEGMRGFMYAGANPQTQNIARMMPSVLAKAGELGRATKGNKFALQQMLQATGLADLGVTPEIATREASISDKERAERDRLAVSTAKEQEIRDKSLYSWQKFVTQLDNAGDKLKAILGEGLVGLTEPLTDLSKAFTETVKSFMESDTVKGWLKELTVQLTKLTSWLKTDQFKQDMEDWLRILDELKNDFSGLLVVLKPFGLLAPTNEQAGVDAWLRGDTFEASKKLPATDFLAMQVRNLNPKLAELDPNLRAALVASGLSSSITSGYRSEAEEAKLRHHMANGKWVTKEGRPVTQPGVTSKHTLGQAADIDSAVLNSWTDADLAKYNLQRSVKGDDVHLELLRRSPPKSGTTDQAAPGRTSSNTYGSGLPTQYAFGVHLFPTPGADMHVNAYQLAPYQA